MWFVPYYILLATYYAFMSISSKIWKYLEKQGAKAQKVDHKKVYTTMDLAHTLKEKLNKIGKTLLVKADGKYYMILVPGHYYLDLNKVKKALKVKKAILADEKYIKKMLDMVPGALHPFTGISKVQLLLDKAMLRAEEAVIRAGSFTESLRMKVKDLKKMENATLGDFGNLAVAAGKKAVKKGYIKKTVKSAKKAVRKAEKKVRKAVKKKRK